MKAVIIEDEAPALQKLESLLKRYDQEIEIIGKLGSVKSSVEWFAQATVQPDLVFMDIRLTDGLSFEIFRQVTIHSPVIFTTAYNEYALEAFKVNSIAYLLKPYSYDDLYESMQKLVSMRENLASPEQRIRMEELNELLGSLQKNYKSRFMVKIGEHIRSVRSDEIHLFFADGRVVYILTTVGRQYIIDHRMEDLQEVLDPETFFRLNRTYIVNINAIKDVIVYSNSRLKVVLSQNFENELIVSRERVGAFKKWFGMS
jgi:two-component system LytT family response regulator